MRTSIRGAHKEIVQMESESSDYMDMYYDKYMEARRATGMPDADANSEDNFIKYMVEDGKLDFDLNVVDGDDEKSE